MIHTRWDKYGRAMTEKFERKSTRYFSLGLVGTFTFPFQWVSQKHNFSLHFPKYNFLPFGNCFTPDRITASSRVSKQTQRQRIGHRRGHSFHLVTTLGTKRYGPQMQRMYTARSLLNSSQRGGRRFVRLT